MAHPRLERTLIVFTPDAVARNMVGRLLQRFEDTLLTVVGLKLTWATKELAEAYCDKLPLCQGSDESYYAAARFLTEGPVVAVVLQGIGAVAKALTLVGGDSPNHAAPGTIRGDFAHQPFTPRATVAPLVHASASRDDAAHEIAVWFHDRELFDHRITASYFACLPLPPPPSPVPRSSLPDAAEPPAGEAKPGT